MKKKILIILIPLAIIIYACECVVDNDTEKIITPTEFANIVFINAVSDIELSNILVYSASKILQRLDTIESNWNKFEAEYKKVGIKVANNKNNLKLVNFYDTTQILFNSVLDIQKDSNYTFVAFGKNKYIQSIFVSDYIETYNPDNIYFRFFNAVSDSPTLTVEVESEGYLNKFSIEAGKATQIFALPNGKFKITLLSADSLYMKVYRDLSFEQGKMNNFILKGIYKNYYIDYGIVTIKK